MRYQQTDNFCKQYIASMQEGFAKRLEYMRKLLEIKGVTITDEVFDSASVSFNVNRPVDNKSDMENMKMQHECGAMSKQTIIDRSPYTTDISLEMERIEAERIKEEQNASGDTLETDGTDADTNNDKFEDNIDDKVD